jgi:predicted metal-binding membrane protein
VLEAVLRRDRVVISAALAVIAALAWAYLLWMSAHMGMGTQPEMSGMDMPGMNMDMPAMLAPDLRPRGAGEFAFMFGMWAVMMVGMMTPSAAPMVLIYAGVGRQASAQGKPFAATGWFLAGYLVVWLAFALLATGAQMLLTKAALLDPMMVSSSRLFGAIVLIVAGLYQWTPLKDVCLSQCQSPVMFIQRHGGFRGDPAGAVLLGLRHGAYCVGCCWVLMAVLFVGGVMNVLWIAALSALVFAEKALAHGRILSRTAGLALVGAGAWMIAA